MSARSSTFSSEEMRSLAWCGLMLIVLRGVFALWEPAWSHRSDIPNATEFLRESKGQDVRVVVFGSSHMQSAFRPDEWSRLANLEEGQVLNLSVSSGRFWHARNMLRETGGLAESVDLVLIEAARWNLNRNRINPVLRVPGDYPEEVRQQGGVLDRLSVDGFVNRVSLLAEMVWPVYQRRTLEQWLAYFSTDHGPVPHAPPIAAAWFENLHAKLRTDKRFEARSIARDHFADPEMSSFSRRNFVKLVDEAGRTGAEVVIVTLPTRGAYQEGIRADARKSDFVNSVDALFASVIGDGVSAVRCERARDCELGEEIFVDYGHVHHDGARAVTGALFERIQRLQPAGEEGGETDHLGRK